MALILLNNITFYENRNTDQNGELSIWVMLQRNLRKNKLILSICSFVIPICLWCAISYLPFIWHPQVQITSSGSVPYLQVGSRVDKSVFYLEAQNAINRNSAPPQGILVNPIYLPAPHEVAKALVTAFTTPPEQPDSPWFHQSLWHSIKLVFSAFLFLRL